MSDTPQWEYWSEQGLPTPPEHVTEMAAELSRVKAELFGLTAKVARACEHIENERIPTEYDDDWVHGNDVLSILRPDSPSTIKVAGESGNTDWIVGLLQRNAVTGRYIVPGGGQADG